MTPRTDWHPDEVALQAYVDGLAGTALAASLEAHVLACAPCRSALTPAVGRDRLDRVRAGLDDRVDRSERPWLERLLVRCGLGEADARVLLAAPSMRRAWWLALVVALGLAVIAAAQEPGRSAGLLLLAPLIPVLATALSYAPALDPSLAVTASTPYPAMRLLLLRSAAVAGTSTLLAAAAALALPDQAGMPLVWLLPAAALTAGLLALSSWVEVTTAAGGLAAAWLTFVVTSQLESYPVYGVEGQLASGALLALAVAALVQQRHRLDPGSPS